MPLTGLAASLAHSVQAQSLSSPTDDGVWVLRLLQWRQMDLEYTMWQMMYLCIAPKTVYVPHSAPSLYQPPTTRLSGN